MFEIKKIGIVKRASALLLDAILLAVLATGFMWIISLICNFDQHQQRYSEYRAEQAEFFDHFFEKYGEVAEFYGFNYTLDEESGEYTITREGEDGQPVPATDNDIIEALYKSGGKDPETKEAYEEYCALPTDAQIRWESELLANLLFMMISLGTLLSYVVLEFIVPVILKNGQTVGKKVFGIGLVRPDCVKINTMSMFARTILGKYAVETMFPFLLIFLLGSLGWLSVILFVAITILNIVLFFATKNRTPIHDIFANTVAVDMNLQMVYATEEELIEAKKALHKQEVENQEG